MEIKLPHKTNPQHRINKTERDKIIKTTSKTYDVNKNDIYPYLPVDICDNLILQNVNLRNAIDILAEDMIYNNITLKEDNNKNNTVSNDLNAKVIDFWENNQEEYCNQIKDYISYGFGASEIRNINGTLNLIQIPADTLRIHKKIINNENYYYAVQKITGKPDVYLRLSHLNYPEEDNELPVCFWIGKGRKSDFFDYPLWIEAFNHVSASVNLDLLDADKINNGNLVSGILVIKRPPFSDDDDLDTTLQDKMENHGNSIFTLDLTSLNPDIPLTVDYIQISESNYTYLNDLADKSDSKILATLRIPKARMMIDDTTESMNSNKTNTLYKIYSLELNNRQRPLEKRMQLFNNDYFGVNNRVEIETPVFVDDKEIEANLTINLFNNGLITLGQAINKISGLYHEFNINNDDLIDLTNPIYYERYYNGNPLGLTDKTNSDLSIEDFMYNIGDYIDTANIRSKML